MIHPEMPQHFSVAKDRHQRLLEEAERYRLCAGADELMAKRPHRWRWIRCRVGDLLIRIGQWLKTDAQGRYGVGVG